MRGADALPAVVVNTDSPVPPYEQVRGQIVEMIQAGTLVRGDRLPPLRQLAADLRLAVGTVARAYRELESAGLIRSRRGGGTRVVGPSVPPDGPERNALLQRAAAEFVHHARLLHAVNGEILAAVSQALDMETTATTCKDPVNRHKNAPEEGLGASIGSVAVSEM
jgi:DNA-binding transcriptional regulator YhcF (GntR family)